MQDEDGGEIFFYRFGDDLAVRKTFEIRGFELYLLRALDFEQVSSYTIPIVAVDQFGGSLELPFTRPVVDVNEPPELLFVALTVPENSPQGTKIGTILARDPDRGQTVSYQIVPDEATLRVLDRFYMNENTGDLFLARGHFLDYETKNTYEIIIKASDNQDPPLEHTKSYTINITNEPEKDLPANLVITPNNDGINDVWVIHGLQEHYSGLRLTIFSSFGQILFQTDNYQNNWDGTYRGRTLPTGVYYYTLVDGGGAVRYKGSISVLN